MNKFNVLILGKIPPPIGGVTVHTFRLLRFCDEENFEYVFYNLKQFNVSSFIIAIKKSNIAHIHANNPLLLLLFTFLCRLFNSKSIITIHGNIGTHNILLSLFEKLAIHFSHKPIVLNNNCLEIAKKLNKSAIIISSFIPPMNEKCLTIFQRAQIDLLKRNSKKVFCTNAFDLVYDKFGNEIYGIIPLVEYFNTTTSIGLIISDPKGSYLSYFKKENLILSRNIIVLTGEHSFFEVLKVTNCFIRNTTTDGDSLSIKEALYLGINVIATNCVDRPEGVQIISKGNDLTLENEINKIIENLNITNHIQIPKNGGIDILNLYKEIISEMKDE